jgi:tetratricopeptide (TPR) repeat protein
MSAMLHLALLFAALPQADADPAPATMLRLYEGAILWGSIESHDAEGLAFVRLDNGGRVRLPWTRLDPAQAEELLEAFGYIDHSQDELMIEANRLVLDDGSEIVGIITNRTGDDLWVKTATRLVPVPKLRLRGATTVVQVAALDVYTGEELYAQELARIAPESAEAHAELAQFCERVLEYGRAVEHYQAALALDPGARADELANRMAAAQLRAANKEQIDYLRQIDTLRGRGSFDQAIAMAKAFGEVFEESDLVADAHKKALQVEKARVAALRERTQRAWFDWSARLALAKARENPGLEATLGWIDESMPEEVLAAVHAELVRTISAEVTPEDVRRYWLERKNTRVHKASYGEGTWLLGREGADKGLAEEAKPEKELTEVEQQRKQIEERLKRFMQNRDTASRKAKQESGEPEEDERALFWSDTTAAERAQWILAYYAENGGDVAVVRFEVRNCIECDGKGIRGVLNVNAAPPRPEEGQDAEESIVCVLCRGVGRTRRVAYR